MIECKLKIQRICLRANHVNVLSLNWSAFYAYIFRTTEVRRHFPWENTCNLTVPKFHLKMVTVKSVLEAAASIYFDEIFAQNLLSKNRVLLKASIRVRLLFEGGFLLRKFTVCYNFISFFFIKHVWNWKQNMHDSFLKRRMLYGIDCFKYNNVSYSQI